MKADRLTWRKTKPDWADSELHNNKKVGGSWPASHL